MRGWGEQIWMGYAADVHGGGTVKEAGGFGAEGEERSGGDEVP